MYTVDALKSWSDFKQIYPNDSKNLNLTIQMIGLFLDVENIKPSGKNTHTKVSYYQLSDFLPLVKTLLTIEGISYKVESKFEDNLIKYKLVFQKGEEVSERGIDYPINSIDNLPKMATVQARQAVNSYAIRHLFQTVFGICESDSIDGLDTTKSRGSYLNARKFEQKQTTTFAEKDWLNEQDITENFVRHIQNLTNAGTPEATIIEQINQKYKVSKQIEETVVEIIALCKQGNQAELNNYIFRG